MTNQLENLRDVKQWNTIIEFTNGGNVKATYEGTYIGHINKNKIALRNVLYISIFKRSLMSINNLSEVRYKRVLYRYNNKKISFQHIRTQKKIKYLLLAQNYQEFTKFRR